MKLQEQVETVEEIVASVLKQVSRTETSDFAKAFLLKDIAKQLLEASVERQDAATKIDRA
jgi:hypothetical protein